MYLAHFGLNTPPFKITPVTNFFFSGAHRGEILDALIYSITAGEGIIKVTGEVGSGKTMLSRMLLERLPPHVQPVYLANPSLSREEMLYAIADGLGLNLEGQRVNVILQSLQNLLAQKIREGMRVVILVDEAHAMPLDTLEELRLLYNMQVGDQKLLQIVLFGQPELNDKLDQPNMRQLKDRIVQHFNILPLSKSAIESYLMFRMRAAGYRGSNVFSAGALRLIGTASNGLLRRINILADKSLLAAYVEDTNNIEAHHVHQAIRDSDLSHGKWYSRKTALGAATLLTLLILGAAAWWLSARQPHAPETKPMPVEASISPAPVQETAPPATVPAAAAALPVAVAPTAAAKQTADLPKLLQQRLAATEKMLQSRDKNSVNIQLFYTEDAQAARMERFLERAAKLGVVDNIYLLPVKLSNSAAYRVLYGSYPDVEAARTGMKKLPPKYQQAFALTLYVPDAATP